MTTSAAADHFSEDASLNLLWGVRGPNGIAAFLNIDERKARYLIDIGALPVKRLGHRTIVASKEDLLRVFQSIG